MAPPFGSAHGPGLAGLFASKAGTKFDNFKIDHRTQKESLNGRWFDYDAHWLTYESLGSLRGDTTNGYAQNSLAVRAGARARYFRYEVTLNQNLAKAGPAFGIRDPDNFFAVTWDRPSEGFRLYKVVDGHKPEVIAYHSTTYTQANRILRIEVTSSGGVDYCTVTLDPYTTPVVLFNNVSLAAHGYSGGQFGAYCSFSLTTSAILDDTKLWIDESGGNTFDKQVFNDDFSSAAVSISHDDNGNLTKDGVYEYVYDAWNRLVQVKAGQTGSAGSLFTTYRYDGLGRRVGKAVGHSGDADTTEWYYYSGHRLLETRNGSNQTTRQYVWGTQYIDEIVREDINGEPTVDNDCLAEVETTAEGTAESNADAAYYYHQDANYNVVAVTGGTGSEAGQVVQRISYSAYGRPTFTDGAGRVRSGPSFGPTNTAGQLVAPSSLAIAWQGLPYDLETGLTYNRARMLHHRLGRFLQRDPLGYVDGMSLYEYEGGNSIAFDDPSGTEKKFIRIHEPGCGPTIIIEYYIDAPPSTQPSATTASKPKRERHRRHGKHALGLYEPVHDVEVLTILYVFGGIGCTVGEVCLLPVEVFIDDPELKPGILYKALNQAAGDFWDESALGEIWDWAFGSEDPPPAATQPAIPPKEDPLKHAGPKPSDVFKADPGAYLKRMQDRLPLEYRNGNYKKKIN